MSYLKYLKALLYIFVPILFFNFIFSIFYYFNMIHSGMMNYLKLFSVGVSMMIGGIYIGSKASKKGWLEGLKISGEVIILFFIIGYLAFDQGFSLKSIIYDMILLVSSVLGSMIGINKRKQMEN